MLTPHPDRSATQIAWVALGAVALGGLVGAAVLTRQPIAKPNADSAPDRTARQVRLGRTAVAGRTVTIHRSRDEVYAFWRDPANLPAFLTDIDHVTDMGDGSHRWVLKAPAGMVAHVDVRIETDRPGEEIAWTSVETSPVKAEGRVTFGDAPGDRGTQVEATITWKPPFGELGRALSKITGRDPATQGRHALKRLKMLLETGEIATARNRRAPTEE